MNKAIHLIENVSLLLEAQYNSKYYLSSDVPIEQADFESQLKNFYDLSTKRIAEKCFAIPVRKDLLSQYRKNLAQSGAANTSYNYIYQITGPLKILNVTDWNEVDRAFKEGILKITSLAKYDDADDFFDAVNQPFNINTIIDYPKFIEKYQGYYINGYMNRDALLYLLVPENDITKFFNSWELVDGNAKRFSVGSEDSELDFPDFVIEDLITYTRKANTRLKPRTKDWLLNNFKKPYSEITLYRGTGIDLSDVDKSHEWNHASLTIEDFEKGLFKRYGIRKLEDIQKGSEVVIKRGKESSWSSVPQISKNFASGCAIRDFNLLVKAIIPADRVLIDFNLLPRKFLQDTFKFWTQNEVLVTGGQIPATISQFWTNRNRLFIEWLQRKGYSFSSNAGIQKI